MCARRFKEFAAAARSFFIPCPVPSPFFSTRVAGGSRMERKANRGRLPLITRVLAVELRGKRLPLYLHTASLIPLRKNTVEPRTRRLNAVLTILAAPTNFLIKLSEITR